MISPSVADLELLPALVRLSLVPYRTVLRFERRISHEGMISVGGNTYSVPDTARRRVLEVHSMVDEIRILDDGVLIASHPPLQGRHQVRIDPAHRRPQAAARQPARVGASQPRPCRRRRRAPLARLLRCAGPGARHEGHRVMGARTEPAPSAVDRIKANLVGLHMPRALEIVPAAETCSFNWSTPATNSAP